MKYISIDIETTGLNPETDQILEFGAVIEDTLHPEVPVEELPTFRRIVLWDRIGGSPGALAMNAGLIAQIASALDNHELRSECCRPGTLAKHFASFLNANDFGPTYGKIEYVVAGKNFGSFDRRFLDKIPQWTNIHQPRRRVLDPGILFFDHLVDEVPPSLGECLKRAGFDKTVNHTAVDDARDVIRVLRHAFARSVGAGGGA